MALAEGLERVNLDVLHVSEGTCRIWNGSVNPSIARHDWQAFGLDSDSVAKASRFQTFQLKWILVTEYHRAFGVQTIPMASAIGLWYPDSARYSGRALLLLT